MCIHTVYIIHRYTLQHQELIIFHTSTLLSGGVFVMMCSLGIALIRYTVCIVSHSHIQSTLAISVDSIDQD